MFSLYGRAGLAAGEARLSRRISRTGFGTARWPSHGPFDLSKGPTSRSAITSRPTGTGDTAALTACLESRLPSAPVRAEGVARSSGDGGRRCRCRGRPGDPWDGSGRPARTLQRRGRLRRRERVPRRTMTSLGLSLLAGSWADS